jgi:hypothetical protein
MLFELFDIENDPIDELLVESGSFYKNVTFLTYIVKHTKGLVQNDFYLIGILICSFDKESFELILNEFIKLNSTFNIFSAIENIKKHLNPDQFNLFKNSFKLFDQEEVYFATNAV